MTTKTTNKAKRSVFIQGRTWFDRANGNTYNTAAVFVDGKFKFSLGMEYGYGDTWKHRAIDALEERRIIPAHTDAGKYWISRFTDLGLDFYSCEQDVKKNQLFKDQDEN